MENSQTKNFTNNMANTFVIAPDLSGDNLWKSLYSHSYTLFFNCETCNHEFEIDGWFYQFASLLCPQCKTAYSGVFGNILPGSRIDHEKHQRSVLKLESFEGQEINIQLSINASAFEAKQDHIILVIFSKVNERSTKPWCMVDWSVKNAKAQYLEPRSNTVPIKREKTAEKKSKSLVPFILLGLLSVVGICSLFLVMTPGIQLFK